MSEANLEFSQVANSIYYANHNKLWRKKNCQPCFFASILLFLGVTILYDIILSGNGVINNFMPVLTHCTLH